MNRQADKQTGRRGDEQMRRQRCRICRICRFRRNRLSPLLSLPALLTLAHLSPSLTLAPPHPLPRNFAILHLRD